MSCLMYAKDINDGSVLMVSARERRTQRGEQQYDVDMPLTHSVQRVPLSD
jgi:hypothetical protein